MKRARAAHYPSGAGSEAGAADLTRPGPGWTPLAGTLGLHLLLVLALAWTGGPGRRVEPAAPARASTLVFVAPLADRKPDTPPLTPPSLPPRPVQSSPAHSRPAKAEPVRPAARPPVLDATIAASATPPAAATDSTVLAPAAPVGATATETAAAAPLPGDLLSASKRMAGRVDRELRAGSSPITAEPDRKWERFADALAGAYVGGGKGVTLSSYTAPDGVVIYRKTIGDRVRCYRSGGVGGLVTAFGAADGQSAGAISCPSGVSWRRQ